jgi:hypothetical protein
MSGKRYFTTADIALASVFCAIWVILNLTVAPISFRLIGLPVIHDLITFLVFLLVAWTTNKFGTVSFVGVVGAAIVLLAGGPPQVIGFAAASILFDVLLSASHHRIQLKTYDIAVAVIATLASAYLAGVLIGIFFTLNTYYWALTFWGGWHFVGGVISIIVTLPIIGILDKAGVKRIKNVQ